MSDISAPKCCSKIMELRGVSRTANRYIVNYDICHFQCKKCGKVKTKC